MSATAEWSDLFATIRAALDASGAEGWLVGGCIRDGLLGLAVRDVDLVLTGDPAALAQALPSRFRQGFARLRRDTLRIVVDAPHGAQVDLSGLHGSTIEEDLARRDFTLNAMALPIARWDELFAPIADGQPVLGRGLPALIDPLGGLDDLRARRLRIASPDAFNSDPGRILRGARFLAHLGLTPTLETETAARAAALQLAELPVERVREEVSGLFSSPRMAGGVAWLHAVGALGALFPQRAAEGLPAEVDATGHLARSLAALASLHPGAADASPASQYLAPLAALPALRAWYAAPLPAGYPRFVALAWGMLAHTLTPHTEAEVASQPRQPLASIPGGQIGAIATAIARCWRDARRLLLDADPSLAAIRHYFALNASREELGVDALVVAAGCAVADAYAGTMTVEAAGAMASRAAHLLAAYFADPTRFAPAPLITGADLLRELPGLRGPEIGRALRLLREAQLDGRIATRAEALALARECAEA